MLKALLQRRLGCSAGAQRLLAIHFARV